MGDVVLFIHVAGAAGWVGGSLFEIVALGRLVEAGGEANGRALELVFKGADVFFAIMFVLVVGTGLTLVISEDQYAWTDSFIWVAIGAIVVSSIWQGLVASKSDKRLIEALKTGSGGSSVSVSRWRWRAWVDVGIILVALWAMVTKLSF